MNQTPIIVGYDVKIYFNNGMPPKNFHKKGRESAVHRWAVLKRNHCSHQIVGTYTHEQWVAVWGEGRM